MKKVKYIVNHALVWVSILFLTLTASSYKAKAQNFAYVDTEFILSQIPEYRSAQKTIDELAAKWQKEIEGMKAGLDSMYKEYRAEEVLLNNEQRKERQQAIVDREREISKYEQSVFGYEGKLFKKREELIKPIQDRVFEAIQKVAKKQELDFIFDKSGDVVMLFTNARYDVSGEVLAELGITPLDDKQEEGNLPPGE